MYNHSRYTCTVQVRGLSVSQVCNNLLWHQPTLIFNWPFYTAKLYSILLQNTRKLLGMGNIVPIQAPLNSYKIASRIYSCAKKYCLLYKLKSILNCCLHKIAD